MNIIYQADQIANGSGIVGDTYRRGAYAEWFVANAQRELWPAADESFVVQAEKIIRIDRENKERKRRDEEEKLRNAAPDDGLPPGPWHFYQSSNPMEISDSKLNQVCTMPISVFANHGFGDHIGRYIARCGSPAVRKIMHRLTDEELHIIASCLDFDSATIRFKDGKVSGCVDVKWVTT